MNKQKGFTLVELMVVMAIIAILSTAGISQYGKFIKSARDSKRITELSSLKLVILDSVNSDGVVPEDAAALSALSKSVTGKAIIDPLDGAEACLTADDGDLVACHYKYAVCDGGTGFVLATSFEAASNLKKYENDDVSTTETWPLDNNLYETGNCDSYADITYEDITNV